MNCIILFSIKKAALDMELASIAFNLRLNLYNGRPFHFCLLSFLSSHF